MDSGSIHLSLDLYRCDPAALDDLEQVKRMIAAAAEACGAARFDGVFHGFTPLGVTGAGTAASTSICAHTWPEHGYAAVDIFSDSAADGVRRAAQVIVDGLGSGEPRVREMRRGVGRGG